MGPFAIVGLSFKFPQDALDEASLWDILERRKNVSTDWPEDRMSPGWFREDGIYARGGHFLKEDVSAFDAPFFSITPKEAAAMDPKQRMTLECAYHTFENAGMPLRSLRGSQTAVFAATMADDYTWMSYRDFDTVLPHTVTGVQPSIIPNRISWYFDLRGPSIHLDTACSGSMIALDMACQSIHCGNASAALVVGSSLMLSPEFSSLLATGKFLSPDSKCFSFDSRANGYSRGEGVVALMVKPLDDALKNGDVIRAVIRGTGSNQDGWTPTLTQPNARSQEALIRKVYAKAGLDLKDTRYYEAHGTGTKVGDPTEIRAIGSVFRVHRSAQEPLYVGSVKSNIGHLEGASAGAGIVKAIMALEKGVIPPTALFEKLNPELDAEFYNVQIPCDSIPWPTSGLRRVSVGSFGYGGTNGHVILDDAQHYLQTHGLSGYHNCQSEASEDGPGLLNGSRAHTNGIGGHTISPKLLVWSAADAGAVKRMTETYKDYYQNKIFGNDQKLNQLAYTLATRRTNMVWRTFAVVEGDVSSGDGMAAIESLTFMPPVRVPNKNTSIAFIFTGQGAQYAQMGLGLLHYPIFEASLQMSDQILATLGCPWSVMDGLRNKVQVNSPDFSQPLCTILQIALVELLRSFGVTCSAVVGHSSGEIAAAYTIGALSHESAVNVAYFRGQVAKKLRDTTTAPGAMMSVNLPEADIPKHLEAFFGHPSDVCVACVNSPTNVTLSGPSMQIDLLAAELDRLGIFARKVNTGVAYHSSAMKVVSSEYYEQISRLEADKSRGHAMGVAMISSVTGQVVAHDVLATPQYWVDNLVSPVRFSAALKTLTSETKGPKMRLRGGGIADLLEIGPHPALQRPVKDSVPKSFRYHPSLRRNHSQSHAILTLLGSLFCHGYPVSVQAGNGQAEASLPYLVDCPRYPFDHSRSYWHESRLSKDFRLRPYSPSYLLGKRSFDWNPLRPTWRNWLNTDTMPWLDDHQVAGSVLCPGTGMLVMAMEALIQLPTTNATVITGFLFKDVKFLAPIAVGKTMQDASETIVSVNPLKGNHKESSWYDVQIFSHIQDRWSNCLFSTVQAQHEKGVDNSLNEIDPNRFEEDQIRQHVSSAVASCNKAIHSRAFYDYCKEHGISYGKSFQLLRDISWDGQTMATAQIDMTAHRSREVQSPVHPAVLDAAVHLAFVLISKGLSEHMATIIPQGATNAWVSSLPWNRGASVTVVCVLHSRGSTSFKSSLYALGEDGTPLCSFETLLTTKVSQSTSVDSTSSDQMLHGIRWKPQLSSLSTAELSKWCDSAAQTYDDSTMDLYQPKMELALRTAARKAIKGLEDGALDTAPQHMRTYAEALSHHYMKPQDGEGGELTDLELDALFEECDAANPDTTLYVGIGRALPDILRGKTDPLEIMFGPTKRAESYYTSLADVQMRDGRLRSLLELASHETPGLRVLEVGAGTGSITRHVLDGLRGFEEASGHPHFANYTFTDISSAFFEAAQEKFGDYEGRLTFKTLDLEHDPEKQGFELGYDIIIAGLVLHATSNLETTLKHLRKLLKPGGHLAFQEIDVPGSACANVTFGTLKGWWLSTEEWRRHSPLLAANDWHELLLNNGFSGADLVWRDYKSDICHFTSMIVSKRLAEDVMPTNGVTDGVVNGIASGSPRITLVVDPASGAQSRMASSITQHYPEGHVEALSHFSEKDWESSSENVFVFLLEVGAPLFSECTEDMFLALQSKLRAAQKVLWVTSLPNSVDGAVDPQAGIAMGLLRTIRTEEPGKHIVTLCIESCSATEESQCVTSIIDSCFEGSSPRTETEFVVRDEILSIGRMVREPVLEQERLSRIVPEVRVESWDPAQRLNLRVDSPGPNYSLQFVEDSAAYDDLAKGEVEIEAEAWSISSSDASIALGRRETEDLGVECGGIVKRSLSDKFIPGDRVAMVSPGCFRSHPRATADRVAKVPDTLSLTDVVAIIGPGITAYHNLMSTAHLQDGDKVLIHSGCSSIGQIAIAIATMSDAEIFTTVSSKAEKEWLIEHHKISEDHIFSSNSVFFAKVILHRTDGYGVDVVLNTLTGDGLRASLECVAAFGRFIDLANADVDSSISLSATLHNKNIAYSTFDLVHFCSKNVKGMRLALCQLMGLVEEGKIRLPESPNVFATSDIENAFRATQTSMSQGHIVVKRNEGDTIPKLLIHKSAWQFDSNASYMVSGGLGGLGRAVIQWMVERGAKNLLVPSRSGAASRAAQDLVTDLTARGVHIETPLCDVASSTALASVLEEFATRMPPIKGCINCSMALQDSIFEKMTHAQWQTTIKSKISTSQNLHNLLPADLDFFILLSSLSGIYGNAGQSNYAAGCTFQDALARSRSAAGYKGSVSIDLGWMRSIGIVAETEQYRLNQQNAGVMHPIEESDLLAVLDYYCDPSLPPHTPDKSQILIGAATPSQGRASGQTPHFLQRSLFAGFDAWHPEGSAGKVIANAPEKDVKQLFEATSSPQARRGIVVDAVKAKLARGLGVAAEEIDPRRSLSEYGADSLIAMELRNWIRKDLGVSVAVFQIMGGLSITAIGDLIASKAEAQPSSEG